MVWKEEEGHCFFHFFLPGVSDKCLKIPQAFLKHIKSKTSTTTVSLKGSGGNIWHVDLIKSIEGMLLQNGWQEFVKDNCIKVGYCLVFGYDGNLHFTVQIFDTTGCERDDSLDVSSCKKRKRVSGKSAQALNDSSYKACRSTSKRNCKINKPAGRQSLMKPTLSSAKRSTKIPSRQVLSQCSNRNNRPSVRRSLCEKPVRSTKRSTEEPTHRVRSNYSSKNSRVPVEGSLNGNPVNSAKTSMKRPSQQVQSNSTVRKKQIAVRGSLREKPASSTKKKPLHQVLLNCSSKNKLPSVKQSSCTNSGKFTRKGMKNPSTRVQLGKSSSKNQLSVRRPLGKKSLSASKISMKRSSCGTRSNCSLRNNRVAARQTSFEKTVRSTKIRSKPSSLDEDQLDDLISINVKREYQTYEPFTEEVSVLHKGIKRVSRSRTVEAESLV